MGATATARPAEPLACGNRRRPTRPATSRCRGPARDPVPAQNAGFGRDVRAAPRYRGHARPRSPGDDGLALCVWGATAAVRPVKPRARRDAARVAVPPEIDDGTTLARKAGTGLDPHATPRSRRLARSRDPDDERRESCRWPREAGEAARAARSGNGASNCVRGQTAARRASRSGPRSTTAPRGRAERGQSIAAPGCSEPVSGWNCNPIGQHR